MAHAYYLQGGEEGIEKAAEFALNTLGLPAGSPDLVVLRHALFSVDDARNLSDIARAAPIGEHKAIVILLSRFFHEAQNALLKLFEEPPPGVTLILVIPSTGILLPTLRSRLAALPLTGETVIADIARDFLAGSNEERAKLIERVLEESKSDKDAQKQAARTKAMQLVEGLMHAADRARKGREGDPELRALLEDLSAFVPLLHTRSAPLKQIFEHLLLVIPKGLRSSAV